MSKIFFKNLILKVMEKLNYIYCNNNNYLIQEILVLIIRDRVKLYFKSKIILINNNKF